MVLTIAERHKLILERLAQFGFVRVNDLAEELNVTTVTLRSDLKALEERQLLTKMHGGARPADTHTSEISLDIKNRINQKQKNCIGKSACAMIQPDDSVIIASGSTVYAFVKQIVPKKHLNVVTHCLSVSLLLSEKENVRVIQLGGELHIKSLSVIGEYTSQGLENIHCSKLFIGVDGIDVESGITSATLEEACLTQRMMKAASKTIVLADSTKFGRHGFGRICKLEDIDTIITDSGISDSLREFIRESGVDLVIAETK